MKTWRNKVKQSRRERQQVETPMVRVSLKAEEINLSNLNNQSWLLLLLLSAITYSSFIDVRYSPSSSLDMRTHFSSIWVLRQWARESKLINDSNTKSERESEPAEEENERACVYVKRLTTGCLCYYCRWFFSHVVNEEEKKEKKKKKKRRRGSIGVDFSTRFFFGWRTTLCHTTGIMMISKDDRRDNVRYPSAWYPGMLRWYDNKDRRPMKISALWQVMTNAVAVVFVLRRSVHSTSRSNPSSTDAKTGGGSNGSIWY